MKEEHDSGNPRTMEEASALVDHVAALFMPWNVDALVAGFTEDCTVRFGTLPAFHGHAALRAFFEARRRKQGDYHVRKQCRALVGDTMTNVWEGTRQDAVSGVAMVGFGVELWVLREGKVAVWEAAFNVAPADAAGDLVRMIE